MEKDILLVGEDNLQLYRETCNDPSLKFRVITDLRACMDAIREKIPDLIIVDYEALGDASLEVAQTLKKYPGTQRICQLFVCKKEATKALLEALYIPVDDYIFFPLDAADFKLRAQVQIDLKFFKEDKKLASVEEKIEELEKLLQIFPDYNAAREELADIYEKKQDVEAALDILLKQAKAYFHQNNFGLAMDVITRMKKILAEKSSSLGGNAQFTEALERCLQILGKK